MTSCGQDVVPAADEGQGAGGQDQVDRRPGAGAEADVPAPGRPARPRPGRRVALARRTEYSISAGSTYTRSTCACISMSRSGSMMAWLTGAGAMARSTITNSSVGAGVADDDLHHEPVDLRLGQRIGALGLDRVLGGHHQERPRHAVGLPADRDLLLLHHLQQRALHLRRRPVDLVGQQQVGEHRPERDLELAAALVVDAGADDVGRHQVRGELDAVELPADRARRAT